MIRSSIMGVATRVIVAMLALIGATTADWQTAGAVPRSVTFKRGD